jgi:hypothetical protein
MAAGGIAVAATLALGVAGAAAAPNPGVGLTTFGLGGTGVTNVNPTQNISNPPFEQVEDGPQTANVPTLAWVGEDVRLVACDDAILPNPSNLFGTDEEQASWTSGGAGNIWTGGSDAQPVFDSNNATNLYINNIGSSTFFYPTGFRTRLPKGCVSADISSLTAGLDEITLNVTDITGHQFDPGTVYSEQFIVVWMTANAPKLTEATPTSISFPTTAGDNGTPSPTSQLTTLGLTNLANFMGDTATPGVFPSLDSWWNDPGNLGTNGGANDPPVYVPAVTTGNNAHPAYSGNNGLIDIKVTGSFPVVDNYGVSTLQQYFSSVVSPAGAGYCLQYGSTTPCITLPNQWPALANLLATSSTQNTSDNTGNGSLWDIHGSPTNTLAVQGHAGNGPATAGPPPTNAGVCQHDGVPSEFNMTTDVVDDCVSNGTGTGDPYSFSRVFGDVTSGPGNTIGPYDDEDPNTTLLSDGRLTTDDAPMPALPVTVRIAANPSLAAKVPHGYPVDTSPIGGIGGLYGVSKWMIYSHDFNGASASPECPADGSTCPTSTTALESDKLSANLYNPYYQEYIPSTLRPIAEASGITGVYGGGGSATSGDDFPGFSNGDTDPYEFWKALSPSSVDSYVSNGCLQYDGTELGQDNIADEFKHQAPGGITIPNGQTGAGLNHYATPDYPTSVLVYTDERGEAYVDYNPGTGFYNNVPIDGNSACDLQGLYGQAIGSSLISAQTEYPYESVPYFPPAGANTLTKTVDSQWSKTLTVYPKGNLNGGAISVVVAHAQNINGTPFSDEEVCLSAIGFNVTFNDTPNLTPPVDVTGSRDVGQQGEDEDCATTGTAGNVAFDVQGSENLTNVDVSAHFVPEHLWRDVIIPTLGSSTGSSSSASSIPYDPAVGNTSSSGASGGSGSGGGSSSSSNTSSGAPAPAGPAPSVAPLATAKTANVCKVESVRLHSKNGHFSVSFKLSCSSSKSASVTIKAFRANGKLINTYRLHVATNKAVSVSLKGKVHRVVVVA